MATFIKSLFTTLESAPYTLLREEPGYQVRRYPARLWVSSRRTFTGQTPDLNDHAHRSGLFQSLFRYITGTNEQQQKMAMTVPVTMQWVPDAGGVGGTYTMAFYMNDEFQDVGAAAAAAPQPTEEGVAMERRPELTVLASTRGGYVSEADWNSMAAALREAAEKNGEQGFDFAEFYRVGYDAPYKFWNRKNEVWYVKEGGDVGKKKEEEVVEGASSGAEGEAEKSGGDAAVKDGAEKKNDE